MKNEESVNRTTEKKNMAKPVAILFSGLFVVALVGLVYLLSSNNKLHESQTSLEAQMEDLDIQRQDLQTELAVVDSNFTQKIAENEELSATLQERVEEVEALEWKLNDARKKLTNSEKENTEIKTRLAMLEKMKVELQSDIAVLAETNTDLKKVNLEIREELDRTNEYAMALNAHIVEMSEENSRIMKRLYTIAPAGFIAENFVVKSEKRNDKLTAKGKRTDEVKVSFDINNVPEDYRQEEEIYLVLAKFDGQPVANIPTKTVRINSQEAFDIKAADIEKLRLDQKQNIKMSVGTGDGLDAGTYNLLVYADHGFLGATSFQLQ